MKNRKIPTLKKFRLHLSDRVIILHNVKPVRRGNSLFLESNPCTIRLERWRSLGICAFYGNDFIARVIKLPRFMYQLLSKSQGLCVPKYLSRLEAEELNHWKGFLRNKLRATYYRKTSMLRVTVFSNPSSTVRWSSVENVEVPDGFSDHGKLSEPFLTHLAFWMMYQGVEMTLENLALGDVVRLGLKEVMLNLGVPTKLHRAPFASEEEER